MIEISRNKIIKAKYGGDVEEKEKEEEEDKQDGKEDEILPK